MLTTARMRKWTSDTTEWGANTLIPLSEATMEELTRHYMYANTPRYIYRQFRPLVERWAKEVDTEVICQETGKVMRQLASTEPSLVLH